MTLLLLAWEKEVMFNVDKKIECLKHRTLQFKTQQVFQNYSSKKCIKELHDRFVIAPIDKATGNVAFICKRFYASVLVNELGLAGQSSGTYIKCKITWIGLYLSKHRI